MAKYIFGDKEFSSKAAARDYFKAIKDKGPRKLHGAEADEVLTLLSHNCEFDERVSGEVVSIFVAQSGNGYCFNILDSLGQTSELSYTLALHDINARNPRTNKSEDIKWFKAAARDAVQPQIESVRSAAGDIAVCAITGFQTSDFQIDHKDPLTFGQLLWGWMQVEDLRIDEVQTIRPKLGPPWFKDGAHLLGWTNFHRQYAQLRVLDRAAHIALPPSPSFPWEDIYTRGAYG